MQEFTIKHQLDCGVRYCDLRIAHRPNDSSTDLYFYHGVYTTLTVEVKLLHADMFVLLRLIFTALCRPSASTTITIKIAIKNGPLAVTAEIRVRPQGTESDQECCVSVALSMSTGRLEPQDETENVSGVFYDYSERSSLSSPPAERPDGEKKRKKSHLSRRVRRVVTGCCHLADPRVNAKRNQHRPDD